MQAKQAHAIGAQRNVYHTPSYGRWATPSAPTFDATGAPKRHTYRPLPSPLHYADKAVIDAARLVTRSHKSAAKLHAKIVAKSNTVPRPVRLIRPDGAVIRATFKHPDAVTPPVCVIRAHDLSKVLDLNLTTLTKPAPMAKAITLYVRDLEREAAELAATK